MARKIDLGYIPRPQFVPFHKRKERFACLVCHRRAGKTKACINDLVDAVLRCPHPRPQFAYIAPFLKQAKGIAWAHLLEAIAPLGSANYEVNQAELRVTFHIGRSRGGWIRFFGSDNPDALRGYYFDGVVLDEYADHEPTIWSSVIRAALNDRK